MIRVETIVRAQVRHRRRSRLERLWDHIQLFLGLRRANPKIEVPPPRISFTVSQVKLQKTSR